MVRPGETQRRPGLHIDGFQGPERPIKEEIEHSYLVADGLPTVFYNQPFNLRPLDFNRHNVFSEFDRQARKSAEHPIESYGLYLMDSYSVHRAEIATEFIFRTIVRITYSVARFDRLGLADNPMFNYKWDRRKKIFQSQLQTYDLRKSFQESTSDPFRKLKGKNFGVIGIGGASDGLQAAQIASMLSDRGKSVEFVASIRSPRQIKEARKVSGSVWSISEETNLSGRNFETRYSGDFNSYVVMGRDREIIMGSYDTLLREKPNTDSIIFVDTGGDVLQPFKKGVGEDGVSLQAAQTLNVNKSVVILAPGIDSPADANVILSRSNATVYSPNEIDKNLILNNYRRWGMAIDSPHTFAFSPLVFQQALNQRFGSPEFSASNETDFRIHPHHSSILLMEYDSLMRNLEEYE